MRSCAAADPLPRAARACPTDRSSDGQRRVRRPAAPAALLCCAYLGTVLFAQSIVGLDTDDRFLRPVAPLVPVLALSLIRTWLSVALPQVRPWWWPRVSRGEQLRFRCPVRDGPIAVLALSDSELGAWVRAKVWYAGGLRSSPAPVSRRRRPAAGNGTRVASGRRDLRHKAEAGHGICARSVHVD